MKAPIIITHEYLNQLEKSILNSEAYQRTLKVAKESFAKDKEALIKAGFIRK